MSAQCCHTTNGRTGIDTASPAPKVCPEQQLSRLTRFIRSVRLIVPGALLVLVPKCPVCMSAYIALGTGVGITVSTATYLRIALIFICITAIAYIVARWLIEYLRRH